MELAVGVGLAAPENLAAVEKCSGPSARGLSELKHSNSGCRGRPPRCTLNCPGRPTMEIPVNNANFGKVTSMNYNPRIIQIGAYYRF